jgi:hypothetical protein
MEATSEKNGTTGGWRSWGGAGWLVVSQGFTMISFLPWLVLAGLAVMAFDSGVSTEAVVFVGAVWSYPLLALGADVAAWVLFGLKKGKAALVVTSLPLVVAIPLVGYFGFVWLSNILGAG